MYSDLFFCGQEEEPDARQGGYVPPHEVSVKVARHMIERRMGAPWEIALATSLSIQEVLLIKQGAL